MESYTIGREQFGMEKEFIIEVVQNCPNPTCRYYKNQMHLGSPSQQYHPMPDASGTSSNRGKTNYLFFKRTFYGVNGNVDCKKDISFFHTKSSDQTLIGSLSILIVFSIDYSSQ